MEELQADFVSSLQGELVLVDALMNRIVKRLASSLDSVHMWNDETILIIVNTDGFRLWRGVH